MKSISKARLSDPTTDRIVSQAIDGINFLLTNALSKTNAFSVSFGSAGSVTITHNLSKPPEGWIVIDRSSAASIYKSAQSSTSITFVSSAACDFKILIF